MQGQTRLLVTGFGPYPGTPDNPSDHLVRSIAAGEARLPPGIRLATHILPTSWAQADRLLPEIFAQAQPDIALHFGHAASSRGFRLEEVARNRTAPMEDVDGEKPSRLLIQPHGPRALRTDVPIDLLQIRLRALGLASELSRNAGNYLCNNIYYRSMTYAKGRPQPALSLFVHIPPASWFASEDALVKGAGAIIRACVDIHRAGTVTSA